MAFCAFGKAGDQKWKPLHRSWGRWMKLPAVENHGSFRAEERMYREIHHRKESDYGIEDTIAV